MKKGLLVLMLAGVMTLCACGKGEEKVIGGNASALVATGGAENSETDNGEDKEGTADASSGKLKGYVFESNGVKVGMDMDVAPIVEALGEPVSYYEAASCAFDGLDKIYTYNGFIIETYPQDDKDLVSTVTFADDSVLTPEGVGIGDSLERVKQVYGEGAEEKGMYVYKKDGMMLGFIIKEEYVVSVEYHSGILE